jgi:phosphoglycerate dehydrogenase-like enzyme
MAVRLAILDDYQGVALKFGDWQSVQNLGVDITIFNDHIPQAKLAETLEPFTMISTMRERTPLPREVLEKLPNLKLLVTNGARNPSIDAAAAKDFGILVVTSGSQKVAEGGNGTKEHIIALILSLTRKIPAYDLGVKSGGPWQALGSSVSQELPFHLKGRTLGLLGLGSLGSFVAEVFRMFDMNIIAWSPHLTASRLTESQKEYITVVSKEELFRQADIISVHMVLSSSSKGIVGESELKLMKPMALLVNTSRGPLVDEQAVLRALKERRIGGGAFDVFDQEPLPENSEWRALGHNVVVTPHVGYIEEPTYRDFGEGALRAITAWLEGRTHDLIPLSY